MQKIANRNKDFICPKCGYPQYCGCNEHCRSRIPVGIKPYQWTKDGEGITCPGCGFTEGADFWLDEEMRQKGFK